MTKQNTNQEKKMKIAEAGILFTLVLGLTIFLGVHFSGQDEAPAVVADIIPATSTEIIDEETIPETQTPVLVETEVALADTVIDITEEVIIKAEPEPRVVTYAMAELAYFDQEYELASDLFDQYTDEHSSNAWGFYMLGLSQWKAGETDVAEESFLAALELKPDHQKSLVNYGRVLIELDRSGEAQQQIEIALAINPENVSAQRVLGRLQHNKGELDAAAETYMVVLRTKKNDVWALNNLGLIRIEQERFADALAPLAQAVSLKSDVACIQNNLGIALEHTGHYTAAGEAFAQALSADANHEKAEVSLARLENMVEMDGLIPVDLVALAAGFSAEVATEVVTKTEPVAEDMEVAVAENMIPDLESMEPSTTENVDPEADGHRNR